MSFKEKMASRKFSLTVGVLACATLLTLLPAIFNVFLGTSIVLLTGSEFVTLVITVFTAYSGLNVAQKRLVDVPMETTKRSHGQHEDGA